MITRRKKRKSKNTKNKRKKLKHFIIKTRRGGGQSQTEHTEIMEKGRLAMNEFRKNYEDSKLRDIYRNAWDIIFLVSELVNIKEVFHPDAFADKITMFGYSDSDNVDDYDYYEKYILLEVLENLIKANNNKRTFSSIFYRDSEKVKQLLALRKSIDKKTYAVIDFLREVVIKLIKLRHYLNEEVTTLQNKELISIFEQIVTTLSTLPDSLGNAFGIVHHNDYRQLKEELEKLGPPFNYTYFRFILDIYIKTFDFIRRTILRDSKVEMHMRHNHHQEQFFDETNLPDKFFTDAKYDYRVH
jgi:hypothetical protein